MSPSRSFSFLGGPIRFPVGVRWLVVGWLVAEVIVFTMLVDSIGLGATLLLGLGTSVLGMVMLRRVGRETMRAMRRSMADGTPPAGGMADGLLSGIGAMLLIVPGFLANAAGLALMAPSARNALVQRFGDGGTRVAGRPARPGVIDLGPNDWTPIDRA